MQMIQTASITLLKKEKFETLPRVDMENTSTKHRPLRDAKEKIRMAAQSHSSHEDSCQHTALDKRNSGPLLSQRIGILDPTPITSIQSCPIEITDSPPSEETQHPSIQAGGNQKSNPTYAVSFHNGLNKNTDDKLQLSSYSQSPNRNNNEMAGLIEICTPPTTPIKFIDTKIDTPATTCTRVDTPATTYIRVDNPIDCTDTPPTNPIKIIDSSIKVCKTIDSSVEIQHQSKHAKDMQIPMKDNNVLLFSDGFENHLKRNKTLAEKLQEVGLGSELEFIQDKAKKRLSCSTKERPYQDQENPLAASVVSKSLNYFTDVSKQLSMPPSTTSMVGKKLLKPAYAAQDEQGCAEIELINKKDCSLHVDKEDGRSPYVVASSNFCKQKSYFADNDNGKNDESQTSNKSLSSPLPPRILSPPAIIQSFVRGDLPNFWQCPQCKHLPLSQRPKHSVLYHYAPSIDKGKDEGVPPTSLVRPIIQVHFNACGNHKNRELNEQSASKDEEISNDDYKLGTGSHYGIHADNIRNSDAKGSGSDDDYVDNLDWNETGSRKTGKRRTRGQQERHSKKLRCDANTVVEDNDNDYGIIEEATPATESPAAIIALNPKYNVIHTPITNNGLAHPTKDAKLTAAIDIVLISQMVRCYYAKTEDPKPHLRLRSNPLPENFPGMECKYCLSSARQQIKDSKKKRKMWFFRNSNQLSSTLLLLEKHLLSHCRSCPQNIKNAIRTAKNQEKHERSRLRKKTGEKITRKEYASVVFKRLGFGMKEIN